ncbi:putative glutamyl-tRNA synthetase, cytoplasmic [Venustampulla echinocandica]|uniref:glutamate--tRNA ligase n=1 Tax=Venustampulla echinocandica TaxID=2656787 RepID=A0A370TLS0_9HELO|nr:putative glutamyl-tRNA synthetase, cytoplasmic [Venustampulla echinocandica]RDL36465.1 putative glutamyl-tRNA synthetase, cytoplasmic [Venustampulla echinocandica]
MKTEELSQLATSLAATDFKAIEPHLISLDKHLLVRTYLEGYSISEIDTKIWITIRTNKVANAFLKRGALPNVARWFNYVEQTHPEIQEEIKAQGEAEKARKAALSKAGASYNIALQETEKGVVTRFPPEPSGYLHIGHAKAALLNDYFAHELYKGTLLLRFDDTNPSKEKQEFQDAIVEDLALMGIKPDKTSYTSDHLETLYQYCIRMIKEGHAYADDTDQETMRDQRMNGIASKNRDNSVEQNLAILEEMKIGTEKGLKNCIRAKLSVDNPNKAMRDPVIYRCNLLPHHRTGTTWKMYPTYDFACPIVDSLEGVTHALRTTEYTDRNPQYQWFLDTLKLRHVHMWDFARMNFIRTELSKRKLTKLVDAGTVWGWDDPRMPTIRGVRRRGMTIPALRDFILKQGPSRNIVVMDWTNFWASNRKEIDPVAPRHTSIDVKDAVKATVTNGPAEAYIEDKPKHGKVPTLGNKKVAYSKSLIFDQEDVKLFKEGEEVTLMNYGNAFVRKINGSNPITDIELELHLEGDFKKTEKKLTWLSTEGQELIKAEVWDFDYLMTKDKLEETDNWEDFVNPDSAWKVDALCDENVKDLKQDDIIQLDRKGYYRVDRAATAEKPLVLFGIPTGKTK